MNALERYAGLLTKVGLCPYLKEEGAWLLRKATQLRPSYTYPECLGGHDFDMHVLFMGIQTVEAKHLLGDKFYSPIGDVFAAELGHNLDQVVKLRRRIETSPDADPDGQQYRANFKDVFLENFSDGPYDAGRLENIAEAVIWHREPAGKFPGKNKLLDLLQLFDRMSRMNIGNVIATILHFASGTARWSNGKIIDLDQPWLCQMPEDQRHTMKHNQTTMSVQTGVVGQWMKQVPPEYWPVVERWLKPYFAYQVAFGDFVACLADEQNRATEDLKLVLGENYNHFA